MVVPKARPVGWHMTGQAKPAPGLVFLCPPLGVEQGQVFGQGQHVLHLHSPQFEGETGLQPFAVCKYGLSSGLALKSHTKSSAELEIPHLEAAF